MRVGIGLPTAVPGATMDLVLDWARKADEGPFSSLGSIDRLVYTNFEPLITLSAIAAITERAKLMTSVLLGPIRNTGILAKQIATLDVLSHGRLVLGPGVGGRADDFRAAPASFNDRGRRFESQLVDMKRVWSGAPVDEHTGPIGPRPTQAGGPELLLGGTSPAALRRIARHADGYLAAGTDVRAVLANFRLVEQAFAEAGRTGKPKLVVGTHFALGPDAADRGARALLDYYAFSGAAAEQRAAALPSTVPTVRRLIKGFSDAGADELMLWPTIPELEQVDYLANLL